MDWVTFRALPTASPPFRRQDDSIDQLCDVVRPRGIADSERLASASRAITCGQPPDSETPHLNLNA